MFFLCQAGEYMNGLEWAALALYFPLTYICLVMWYWYGPEAYGFGGWAGRSNSNICALMTNGYIQDMTVSQCSKLIWSKTHSYVVGAWPWVIIASCYCLFSIAMSEYIWNRRAKYFIDMFNKKLAQPSCLEWKADGAKRLSVLATQEEILD